MMGPYGFTVRVPASSRTQFLISSELHPPKQKEGQAHFQKTQRQKGIISVVSMPDVRPVGSCMVRLVPGLFKRVVPKGVTTRLM